MYKVQYYNVVPCCVAALWHLSRASRDMSLSLTANSYLFRADCVVESSTSNTRVYRPAGSIVLSHSLRVLNRHGCVLVRETATQGLSRTISLGSAEAALDMANLEPQRIEADVIPGPSTIMCQAITLGRWRRDLLPGPSIV